MYKRQVLVFHATGVGGRTMESLIADGYIVGSLDMTTTEPVSYTHLTLPTSDLV